MQNTGIIEIDVHEMNCFQAKAMIDSRLKKAKADVYVLRVVHGYRSGTALRDMVRREYRKHPKIKRVEISSNQGITDLVLRDLF